MFYILANALFLSLMLSFSHGLLKWISIQEGGSQIDVMFKFWWVLTTSIFIYVIIFFYYAYILRFASISILLPVYTGLSIIFVFIMGVWFFQEPWNWQHVAGCLLIIAGVFLVSGMGG